MSNTIKYSTQTENNTLKKGDFVIGVNNVDYGPTNETGYHNTITPPSGGYVVYKNRGDNQRSIYVAESDEELVSLKDDFGATGSTANDVLVWAAQQDDVIILNNPLDNIVTDGLKLYLDSRNTASYPRGSTWYDLAQGIKFNQVDTPLPVLDILGDPSFEFNSSGYWQSESDHGLVDMGGETTLLMWVDSTNIGERDTIFEKAGVQYNSYEHEIAVTWETNERFSWYSRRGTYGFGSTSSLSTSGWYLVGIKMSTGKIGGVARRGWYSINGGSWVENYTDRGTTAILPAGPIRIGSGYAGPVESGGISIVMIYDRQLTDDEVSQIYINQSPYFT